MLLDSNTRPPLQRPTALRAIPLFLSTLLLVAAVVGAFVLLFAHPDQHRDLLPAATYALVFCYLIREAVYFICSPPRYGYFLGRGLLRVVLRLMAFVIRCGVRLAQAAAYTALCIIALSLSTTPTPEAVLAGLTLGFIAISVIQESEWSSLAVPRGDRVEAPHFSYFEPSGGGGGGGGNTVLIYVHTEYREIHHVEQSHEPKSFTET